MTRVLPAVCLLAFAAAVSFAAAYDTPEAAAKDPSFALQGEYSGAVGPDGQKIAAQIIALGKDQYRMVMYMGGLPGDGWTGQAEHKREIEGKATDGKIAFEIDKDRETLTVADGKISSSSSPGTLDRVERKSSTLAKPAPAGATVLFDGTKESLANWKPGAKITDDGLLMQGVTSNATFGDCTVHVEFRLPYQPDARGQGRGNSGCYLQGRFEVQMLDSFGLSGEHNECGGLYSVAKPAINMCYPPLTWQTYDIEFTAARFDADGKKTANARITVVHNGVKIHDNVELPKATTASPVKEGPEPGPIHLQDHGNPVRYRNIWVMPKSE